MTHNDIDGLAHEIWAMAQGNNSIESAVARISEALSIAICGAEKVADTRPLHAVGAPVIRGVGPRHFPDAKKVFDKAWCTQAAQKELDAGVDINAGRPDSLAPGAPVELPKPVAWLQIDLNGGLPNTARNHLPDEFDRDWWKFEPLYTEQALRTAIAEAEARGYARGRAERVGLSDGQIAQIAAGFCYRKSYDIPISAAGGFARAILAASREGKT